MKHSPRRMTHQEVLQHLCRTVGLAYHSLGDYQYASDCFCQPSSDFRNDGVVLEYVRDAVIEKLKRDNIEPELCVLNDQMPSSVNAL